jgi:PAS domain S-box-containing protein
MSDNLPTSPDNGDAADIPIDPRYFQALRDAPVPVLVASDDGRLLMLNRAFESAIGFSRQEIPTLDAWTHRMLNDASPGHAVLLNALFDPTNVLVPIRVSVTTTNGQPLIWELFNTTLGRTANGRRMAIIVASDVTQTVENERRLESAMNQLEGEVSKRTRDLNTTIRVLEGEVAERKRIGDALNMSRERLKNMSRRILDVLEADRQTISKELHDSIGASLAAIKFSLEEKELQRQQQRGRLDEPLTQEIAYLLETIKETKRISANLRPTTLDDLGLMATIQWYLRQFQRLYGNIQVDFEKNIAEEDVPEAMKIIIYRIVQEGLSNAEKHSEAHHIHLQMGYADGGQSISLRIEDDGRGFDVNDVLSEKDPLSGYGLTAMRERCEIIGGSFHIDSHPGQGTRINAILPI